MILRHLLPHPILTLVLWLIWLLLNDSFSAGHIVLGLILGILIPMFTTRFWPEKVCMRRPMALLKFIVIVLWDILVANIVVAKLILSNKNNLQPKFITIDLDITHPLGIGILANTVALTPGTVSCDLVDNRHQLLVHALHIEDPQAVISEIKHRYETLLMEVFPPC